MNVTQITQCNEWYLYEYNTTTYLNIDSLCSSVLNNDNYICTYGHNGEQFDQIINEWNTVDYGRNKGINNINMPYYMDTKDSVNTVNIFQQQYIYLLFSDNINNIYIWSISSLMDYNISNSHAYCNITTTNINSIMDCNEWYINTGNNTFYIDINFKFLPNKCPYIGDDLCLYNSKNDDINGNYEDTLSINYHNTWFRSSLTSYYIGFDPIQLKWIISNDFKLNPILLYCNISNINPFNPMLCNNNWYNGNTMDTDTLLIYNSTCDNIPTPGPTNSPTNIPSFNPSLNPSITPTIQTVTPSVSTIYPSINPTILPTESPSISLLPSISPLTSNPTFNPTFKIIDFQDIVTNPSNVLNQRSIAFVIIVIIVGTIVTCVTIFICVYQCYKYHEKQEQKKKADLDKFKVAITMDVSTAVLKTTQKLIKTQTALYLNSSEQNRSNPINTDNNSTEMAHATHINRQRRVTVGSGYTDNEDEKNETPGVFLIYYIILYYIIYINIYICRSKEDITGIFSR